MSVCHPQSDHHMSSQICTLSSYWTDIHFIYDLDIQDISVLIYRIYRYWYTGYIGIDIQDILVLIYNTNTIYSFRCKYLNDAIKQIVFLMFEDIECYQEHFITTGHIKHHSWHTWCTAYMTQITYMIHDIHDTWHTWYMTYMIHDIHDTWHTW